MATIVNVTADNRDEIFNEAYEGSYYTVLGAAGEISEWIDGMTEMLQDKEIGTPVKFIIFTGKDMNARYDLTDSNAYPDDLHCLAFSLDGLEINKLAVFKLQMGDRWFDDIVNNNERRQMAMNG